MPRAVGTTAAGSPPTEARRQALPPRDEPLRRNTGTGHSVFVVRARHPLSSRPPLPPQHEWYLRGEFHADQYPHGRVWDEGEVDRAVRSLRDIAEERFVLLEDEAEAGVARKLLRSLSFNYSPAPWLCFKCATADGVYLLVDAGRRTARRLCGKTRRNLAFYKHGRTSTRRLFG